MTRGRAIRILVALAIALVLADGSISLFMIRDGVFLDIPLPPFGEITHPRQRGWLKGLGAAEQTGIGRFDADLGWTWAPSTYTADGKFEINSLGARGPKEYGPRPEEGKRRIVTFGDSFTFGDEIPDRFTYQYIIEAIRPEFEAINFGVSGYGTDQALLRYRRLGRELDAEVVVIGILLENIGRNVNRYRPLWNPSTGFCATKPRFVLEGTGGELRLLVQPFQTREELRTAILEETVLDLVADHEYWVGRPSVPTGKLSSLVRIAAGFGAHRRRSPASLWQARGEEPFRVTLALLEAFHREALANGARLAPILIFPSKEDLRDWSLQDKTYWNGLHAELARRSIPFVDPIPALTARQRELDADPELGSLYFGGHLSSVGNSVVARELLAWIDAQSR